jgi:hypothetical protein
VMKQAGLKFRSRRNGSGAIVLARLWGHAPAIRARFPIGFLRDSDG